MALKILVIDDDETMNECLAECFDPAEYEITVKATGREGVEFFKENRPDIVILDLGLADIDGASVLNQLREIDPGVPVGVLSGYASRREEMIKLGADSFRMKPLKIEEIERWFGKIARGERK